MANQLAFEGLEVSDKQFELGGGGTSRDTNQLLALGDVVEGTWRGKVVNVKHHLKSGEVVREQTINIEDAAIGKVLEHFTPEPKVEQQELKSVK